ncbi:helix-turn-helix domain-containing protein [Cryobacterium sp. PH31-L1]|uniref:helix-turn-helix domain-containing protein n=1 Tax=Cryobacterium sp. PH31-L1 TaxID=3046199 RepID=UPI0024B88377|nr:helix-turn-helix domain-containing protein [Cryobacterium sp. PH31-L1]MDJ0378001.1 helix-turn-helix domain-containing protein [Cryobacterium sp. PH31-L1]
MKYPFIIRLFKNSDPSQPPLIEVHARVRVLWIGLAHLWVMDTHTLSRLGLEPVLTTSELAEYLGVHVQAIYDLRNDGRGPTGFRVGREIRYHVSDVLSWLDSLREPDRSRRTLESNL